jgi:hypothetical protein
MQKPQRPFVPHRTPKTARPTITASEFRLYRPFLPGSQRETVESAATMTVAAAIEVQPASSVRLRPIQDFLASSPPPPGDELFELPPVEHFLDPLPIVEQFAPDSGGALSDDWPASNDAVAAAGTQTVDQRESGWAETDWQSYDWRAAGALGEGPDAEASNAWASTDWDGKAPPRDPRPTAAQAIASALDQIAQQIREGDLTVPGSASDPAKIAATLAALLGVKR